jgi:hypothetical protein
MPDVQASQPDDRVSCVVLLSRSPLWDFGPESGCPFGLDLTSATQASA